MCIRDSLTEAAKHRLGRVLASDESVERAAGEAAQWRVDDEMLLRWRQRPTLAYEPGPEAATSASTPSASTTSASTTSASTTSASIASASTPSAAFRSASDADVPE